MNTPATLWLVCALIALGLEFMTGTLYLLVVALALTGGALVAWSGSGVSSQLLAASGSGILAYALVSRWKSRIKLNSNHSADDPDQGQEVRILRITAPGLARVFYRGAEWDARFEGPSPEAGTLAKITGHDGNTLIITLSTAEKTQ